MGEGGWDLQAVVSGCSGLAAEDGFSSSFPPIFSELSCDELEAPPFSFPDLAAPPADLRELEELCRPFISKPAQDDQISTKRNPSSSSTPPSPSSSAVVLQISERRPAAPPTVKPGAARRALLHAPVSKRRKNQQKKVVCQVPADKISSDLWAWRKYGQKPIKGSPFPRGYYKCSSSKGCLARKQVERSPVDPGIFIITYSAEHNHPIPNNRQKQPTSSPSSNDGGGGAAAPAAADLPQPACTVTPSCSPSLQQEQDEEEDLLHVEDMDIIREEGMLFLDPEEESESGGAATAAAFGAVLSDHFGGGFPAPWLTSSAAAVAGGN